MKASNLPPHAKKIERCKKVFHVVIMNGWLLFQASECYAQGYFEAINLSDDIMPLTIKFQDRKQHFIGNHLRLNVTLPLSLKRDTSQFLMLGANVDAIHYGGTHAGFEVHNLYGFSPIIGYGGNIDKNWNLTALFVPFLNSDYKSIRGKDIRFGAIIRGSHRLSQQLLVRATLGYRQQFYGSQYIVLVGFDWELNYRWRAFGDLPNNATVNYAIDTKTNAGLHLMAGNTSYRLQKLDRYLTYNAAQMGIFTERYLSDKWVLRGTVAYAFTRDLQVFNKDDKVKGVIDAIVLGKTPMPLNPPIDKGLTCKLSLGFRIKTNN